MGESGEVAVFIATISGVVQDTDEMFKNHRHAYAGRTNNLSGMEKP